MPRPETLSKRERQAMDVIYALGSATAKDVQKNLPDPPSYSAVRAVLTRLVDAGLLQYQHDGPRYVYSPRHDRQRIRRDALRKLVDTFFNGSALTTINALLGYTAKDLSREELDQIAELIAKASEAKDDSR